MISVVYKAEMRGRAVFQAQTDPEILKKMKKDKISPDAWQESVYSFLRHLSRDYKVEIQKIEVDEAESITLPKLQNLLKNELVEVVKGYVS